MQPIRPLFTPMRSVYATLPSLPINTRQVTAIACGILSLLPLACQTAHAQEHDSVAHHILQEIVEHAIWHHVGKVLHLSHCASLFFCGLFSFQSLGERDTFYIENPMAKPQLTQSFDPREQKMVPCLILSNGKKIMGKDLFILQQALRHVQLTSGKTR